VGISERRQQQQQQQIKCRKKKKKCSELLLLNNIDKKQSFELCFYNIRRLCSTFPTPLWIGPR
jgi:hypothetical protein